MNRIYQKNKLMFALIWIGVYIVLSSVADAVSEEIGIAKLISAPIQIILSAVLMFFIIKNGLTHEFGLDGFGSRKKEFIYYIPLIIISTVNFWNGIGFSLPPIDTALYIISMIFVGLIEELIFRGLLFGSLIDSGIKKAYIINSLTFGIGHIINLINGAEILPTVLQIIYATAIGFLFTLIFHKGGSLIPCIIAHSFTNATSVFGVTPDNFGQIITSLILTLLAVLYSVYIIKSVKTE